MRGKNRIGWGIGLLGLGIALLLPLLEVQGEAVYFFVLSGVLLSCAGASAITWGAIVLGLDAKRARQRRGDQDKKRAVRLNAKVLEISAEISQREYWLRVASDYGDSERIRQLEAELARLHGEHDITLDELKELGVRH